MPAYARCVMLFCLSLCLCACSKIYLFDMADEALQAVKLSHDSEVTRPAHWVLHPETRVYLSGVALTSPLHGDADNQLPDAQQYLHSALNVRLAHVFADVVADANHKTLQAALLDAYQARADILVFPQIITASDGLNTPPERLSGLVFASQAPFGVDKLDIKINIYDVNSGRIMDSARVRGASHYFATDKMTLVGLMRKIASDYVDKISVPTG